MYTYPDNVVITPIYDVSGVSEYISKEFETSESDSMSFASADTIIFDYQIFNPTYLISTKNKIIVNYKPELFNLLYLNTP